MRSVLRYFRLTQTFTAAIACGMAVGCLRDTSLPESDAVPCETHDECRPLDRVCAWGFCQTIGVYGGQWCELQADCEGTDYCQRVTGHDFGICMKDRFLMTGDLQSTRMDDNLVSAIRYANGRHSDTQLVSISGAVLDDQGTIDTTQNGGAWLYTFESGGSEPLTMRVSCGGTSETELCAYSESARRQENTIIPGSVVDQLKDATQIVAAFGEVPDCSGPHGTPQDTIIYYQGQDGPRAILSTSGNPVQSFNVDPITREGTAYCPTE